MILVIMIIAVIMIIKNFLQLCCLCAASHALAPQRAIKHLGTLNCAYMGKNKQAQYAEAVYHV